MDKFSLLLITIHKDYEIALKDCATDFVNTGNGDTDVAFYVWLQFPWCFRKVPNKCDTTLGAKFQTVRIVVRSRIQSSKSCLRQPSKKVEMM